MCCLRRFVEISLLALGDLIKSCGSYGDGAVLSVVASYEAFDESVSEVVLDLLAHSNMRVKRVAAVTVRAVGYAFGVCNEVGCLSFGPIEKMLCFL
jgi:hypothetical protein